MNKILKRIGLPLLMTLLVSTFPSIFLYCQNAGEMKFSEAVPSLLAYTGIGIGLFVLSRYISQTPEKSAIIASMFSFIILNFVLLEKIIQLVFQDFRYWHTLTILFVIFLHFAYLICYKLSLDWSKDIVNISCFVFCCLIAFNIIMASPNIIRNINIKEERIISTKLKSDDEKQPNPNVYFLIFDEFASFRQMHDYYGYDNKMLYDFLERNNFTVSYNSYNDSVSTTTVTCNLMNLDYIVTDQFNETEKRNMRKQGAFFNLFKEYKYDILGISNAEAYGIESVSLDEFTSNSLNVTMSGETFSDLLIKQSIYYPFWRFNTAKVFEDLQKEMNFLKESDCNWEKPTLIFSHFNFPHPPFLVDEDGHPISANNYFNWKDNKIYLGQYKYASRQIVEIVDSVLKKDPRSIIILQSDHGARATTDAEESKFPMNVMSNYFSAVYYQGESVEEIRDQSGVNTLRLIIDRLFGENYGVVEVPEAK